MPATATNPHRICSRCNAAFPLTDAHFYRRPGRDFESWCRDCGRTANSRRRRRAAAHRRSNISTATRQFGVEIEYIGGRYEVQREMLARGLECSIEGYTHRVMRGWKIVTDGSISNGYELVSPPLSGAAGREQVRIACEALAAAGVRVNRSCGLHVHHDVNDLSLRAFQRIYRGWAVSQHAIDQLVAASRRGGHWAGPIRRHEVDNVDRMTTLTRESVQRLHTGRYRALNIACFPRYGTVEVRQHQGTLNAAKIIAWIDFGQAMIAAAKGDAEFPAALTAHDLLDGLANHGLATATVGYLKGRAEAFGFGAREAVAA